MLFSDDNEIQPPGVLQLSSCNTHFSHIHQNIESPMLFGLQADWFFSAPCSAEEEQACWCWFWEIVKQTAVGMGSQGSLIQVEHFQFLGCIMGAVGTLEPWHGCIGVHLELIQGGPDYQTSRRWALLSDSNPWLDAKCYSCHCHQWTLRLILWI